MKSKILILLFTILTFGIFLIPNTFAKQYTTSELNKINRVSNIDFYDDRNLIEVFLNIEDINTTGSKWCFSCSLFNDNFKNIIYSMDYFGLNYKTSASGSTISTPFNYYRTSNTDAVYFYYDLDLTGRLYGVYFNFLFSNTTDYNTFKNSGAYFNCFAYRYSGSNAPIYSYTNTFITNQYYGGFVDKGVFNYSSVQLRYYGSNSYTDISESCLFYNTFQFDSYYVNLINNTNNVNSNGNYYIRFYFNNKVKNLSNFNLSYLELMAMRGNNTLYNDLTSIRNALPIINNNITLYNSNATLFNTSDLVNSGYGDFYIEYIDFRIVDYTFKSSTYFNSGLGISGYLSATKISAMSVNAQEAYNNGFSDGSRVATEEAYNNGFNAGVASNRTSFDNLMLSVANVPMTIISSMLGFEVLGVNLLGFFMGIITLLLFVKLMKKFKE